MYWEDADWCKRAHDDGLRVIFEPALAVVHYQGTSSASKPRATTLAFHRSAYRYYRKHVARRKSTRAYAAVLLALRCAIKLMAPLFPRPRTR
jgi:GT2 family glycosyltransferase